MKCKITHNLLQLNINLYNMIEVNGINYVGIKTYQSKDNVSTVSTCFKYKML